MGGVKVAVRSVISGGTLSVVRTRLQDVMKEGQGPALRGQLNPWMTTAGLAVTCPGKD